MALLFSADQLAEMAAYFGNLALKDTCQILRGTRTPDGQQGFRETWATIGIVPCLVTVTGAPRLEDIAQQTTSRNENLFFFAPGTDVVRTDRLLYDGDTYEIIDTLDPTTYTVWQRVIAKHMEAGSGS